MSERNFGKIVSMPTFIPPVYKYCPEEGKLGLIEESNEDWMKDDTFLLNSVKELTRRIRPACDIDGLPVGAIWFQLKRSGAERIITEEMSSILRGNMTVCISCYFNSAYPPHLCADDFEKCDVLSLVKAEPGTFDHWTNDDYAKLMDVVKETNGKDWQAIFSKFPEKKEEEVILKLLKLPFMNISNLFVLEEKQVLDLMGANPETGLYNLKQSKAKTVNPLEPHVNCGMTKFGILKDFLTQFKNSPKPQPKPQPKETKKEQTNAFYDLINIQLDLVADRLKYLEEFEEIVVHEKKQIEV